MNLFVALRNTTTPRPLHVEHGEGTCFHDGNLDSITSDTDDGGEPSTITVAEVWPTAPQRVAQIDAALLAHGYNNIGTAVSLLLKVRDAMTNPNCSMPAFDTLQTALNDFLEVQGI